VNAPKCLLALCERIAYGPMSEIWEEIRGTQAMKKITTPVAAAALLVFSATISLAQTSAPVKVVDTSKGKASVDPHGMTLYTFDRDTVPGKSSCNGKCAGNWPSFVATAGAANMDNWTVFVRSDGSRQWAYKGKPLYRWMDDKQPGDVDGDGRNNVWHVAVP
jgi:predicted lipoprotein with Yx(FWY)xxD motif